MNAIEQSVARSPAAEQPDWSFSLIGPLPVIAPDEQSDHFTESKDAHGHYMDCRSGNAAANTMTYHVADASGEVAGFISYKMAREKDEDQTRIFNSVEYIYVKRMFRGRGLSTLLVRPLLQDVRLVLHQAARARWNAAARLHSASYPQSPSEHRVLRKMEMEFLELAKRYRRVELIGRHVSWPLPEARQCALEVDPVDQPCGN